MAGPYRKLESSHLFQIVGNAAKVTGREFLNFFFCQWREKSSLPLAMSKVRGGE